MANLTCTFYNIALSADNDSIVEQLDERGHAVREEIGFIVAIAVEGLCNERFQHHCEFACPSLKWHDRVNPDATML